VLNVDYERAALAAYVAQTRHVQRPDELTVEGGIESGLSASMPASRARSSDQPWSYT
jgi:hypothetical protein